MNSTATCKNTRPSVKHWTVTFTTTKVEKAVILESTKHLPQALAIPYDGEVISRRFDKSRMQQQGS